MLQTNDTGLKEGMKTQDHLRAPLQETLLRSKDTDNLKAEGVCTGTQHSETEKQTILEWILFESTETVSRK